MRPIVVGFHGCEQNLAAEVVAGKASLQPGKENHDWLGAGVYFWEEDPDRALEWAVKRAEQGKIREPAVLGAVIDLTECLNLVQVHAAALVEEAYQHLENTNRAAGRSLPKNRGFQKGARFLNYLVFQTLHALREDQGKEPFGSVRAFFPEGEEVFPDAGIARRDHIQICVRDPRRIIGYFLPRV